VLGGKLDTIDQVEEPNTRVWKPDIKIIKAVIAFAIEMKRLANDVQGDYLLYLETGGPQKSTKEN
jgi:hypothetical protein